MTGLLNDTDQKSAFEIAHAKIVALLDHFAKYARDTYLLPGYQQAAVRKDFIDPLLKALGWDVDHEREHNPYEQEVKVERGVSVGAARAQKRADYAFYLKPNFRDVRFFVEATKPSVDLARSVDAHFQTLRYGYSANTPLAVLTDFEQIRILDCRLRPHPDTALDQVYKSWHYSDFRDAERFAEFYWLFSREAHADGSYQRRIDECQCRDPDNPKLKFDTFGHDLVIRHEHDIRKRKGAFSQLNQPAREAFMGRLTDVIAATDVTIVAIVIDKLKHKTKYNEPYHPYHLAMQFGLERVAHFLKIKAHVHRDTFIVFEARGAKEDQALELEFRRVCDGANRDRNQLPLRMLVADKKTNSEGLQLADLTARPIGLSVLRPGQPNRA